MGDLYGNDTIGLGLSLEYWCVPEPDERSAVSKHHSTHRQVRVVEGGWECRWRVGGSAGGGWEWQWRVGGSGSGGWVGVAVEGGREWWSMYSDYTLEVAVALGVTAVSCKLGLGSYLCVLVI